MRVSQFPFVLLHLPSETVDFAPGEMDARNLCVVFHSGLFGPLCENMTSSTKPEVHDVLYCIAVGGRPSHGHR